MKKMATVIAFAIVIALNMPAAAGAQAQPPQSEPTPSPPAPTQSTKLGDQMVTSVVRAPSRDAGISRSELNDALRKSAPSTPIESLPDNEKDEAVR